MAYVRSSAVSRVEYDSARRILYVTFLQDPKVYAYVGVPPAEYEGLMRAPSVGAYLSLRIKPRYRFHALTSVRLPPPARPLQA